MVLKYLKMQKNPYFVKNPVQKRGKIHDSLK